MRRGDEAGQRWAWAGRVGIMNEPSITPLCVLQEKEIGRGVVVYGRLDELQNSTTKTQTQTLHFARDSRSALTLSRKSRQSYVNTNFLSNQIARSTYFYFPDWLLDSAQFYKLKTILLSSEHLSHSNWFLKGCMKMVCSTTVQ